MPTRHAHVLHVALEKYLKQVGAFLLFTNHVMSAGTVKVFLLYICCFTIYVSFIQDFFFSRFHLMQVSSF